MIENRLRKCCQTCPHIDVETVQYTRRYTDLTESIKDIQIFCRHEAVCKEYLEETEVTTDENACSDK